MIAMFVSKMQVLLEIAYHHAAELRTLLYPEFPGHARVS